jgi:hypothetical protein
MQARENAPPQRLIFNPNQHVFRRQEHFREHPLRAIYSVQNMYNFQIRPEEGRI